MQTKTSSSAPACRTWRAVLAPRMLTYSSAPAMKPSSDMVTEYSIVAMRGPTRP